MNPPPAGWLPAVSRRSVLVLALALAALLAPWPGVGRAFGAFFSGYGNAVVATLGLGDDARPRFSLPPRDVATAQEGGDWAVRLAPTGGGVGDVETPGALLDTRILGWTPFAVLFALVAASALPRRRRLLVFGFAAGLLLLRLAVAIALPVARSFATAREGGAAGPLGELVWFVFVVAPAMSYATPLLLWWIGFALTTPGEAKPSAKAGRAASGRRVR